MNRSTKICRTVLASSLIVLFCASRAPSQTASNPEVRGRSDSWSCGNSRLGSYAFHMARATRGTVQPPPTILGPSQKYEELYLRMRAEGTLHLLGQSFTPLYLLAEGTADSRKTSQPKVRLQLSVGLSGNRTIVDLSDGTLVSKGVVMPLFIPANPVVGSFRAQPLSCASPFPTGTRHRIQAFGMFAVPQVQVAYDGKGLSGKASVSTAVSATIYTDVHYGLFYFTDKQVVPLLSTSFTANPSVQYSSSGGFAGSAVASYQPIVYRAQCYWTVDDIGAFATPGKTQPIYP